MNILVSVNSRYFSPLKVLLYSLSNTQSEKCTIYFLNLSLPPSLIQELNKFCTFLNFSLNIIDIPKEIKEILGNKEKELPDYLSCETYVRLFSPILLSQVDRILWLDADCLVQKNLQDFYNQDLEGRAISACDHCNWILPGVPEYSYWEYPKRKRKPEHFNAGVILFDLDRCRKLSSFKYEEMRSIIETSNLDNCPCYDQSILNCILPPNYVKWESPLSYNLFINQEWDGGFHSNPWQYELYEKANILHFCSNIKPWNLLDYYDPTTRGIWLNSYEKVLKIDQEILKQSIKQY